ncbi:septum formation protein Maf [candidate division KSB1 bacterium]|nr:septum formation protein Maf [candidate division KSB1 bacterium]
MALLDAVSRQIILATASPRRIELFKLIHEHFATVESNIDESAVSSTEPREIVIELARRKVEKVSERYSDGILIGADSIVVLGRDILGKPGSPEEARAMLQQLSGRQHQVFTGLSVLLLPEKQRVDDFEATTVRFKNLSPWEINRYIQIGNPFDKAGAYGIQNEAALFVESIQGCFYNVMGLPVARLFKILNPFLDNFHGARHD